MNFKRFAFGFLLVVGWMQAPACVCAQTMTLEELVAKNNEYWATFKKLDVRYKWIEHEFSSDENNKPIRIDTSRDYHWVVGDECEKIVWIPPTPAPANPEVLPRNSSYYLSKKWDIESFLYPEEAAYRPTSVLDSVENGRGVAVMRQDHVNTTVELLKPTALFLSKKFFCFADRKSYISLSEHVQEWKSSEPPVRSVDQNGDVLWTVRFYDPISNPEDDSHKDDSERSRREIVFNESKNFILHRCTTFIPAAISQVRRSDTDEPLPIEHEVRVFGYHKIGDDLYFPKRASVGLNATTAREFSVDGVSLLYQNSYEVERVLYNDLVTEDACFKIPEFCKVHRNDLLTDEDFVKGLAFGPTSIWGPNDEPAATFTSQEAFDDYVGASMFPKRAFFSWRRIASLVSGVALILIAFFMRFRERRKKAVA